MYQIFSDISENHMHAVYLRVFGNNNNTSSVIFHTVRYNKMRALENRKVRNVAAGAIFFASRS